MTTTNDRNSQRVASATLKAYEDRITAHIQEGRARLDLIAAKAKERKAQAEIDAISSLKTTMQDIDRKVKDLKATSAVLVSRAKADIDAEVAKFMTAIDQLAARFKTHSATK